MGYVLFFVFYGLVLAAIWVSMTRPNIDNIMMWAVMVLAGLVTLGLIIWLFLINM